MSIDVKKPDSLVNAVNRIAKLCPFDPNSNTDEGKKMDMDSAVAELRSAFKEYADLIEREVIKKVREYQAEYEDMWYNLIENNDNDIFEVQLEPLMKKNRHLEDKLHGFIAKKADTIFEYSYRYFQYVFNRYTCYNHGNGRYTETYKGNYESGYECINSELMKYVDKNITIGIRQMKKYISNALQSHNESIIKIFFANNKLSNEYIKEKQKSKKSLKQKLSWQRRKKSCTIAMNMYYDTLETTARDIMENGWNGNNKRVKKRVRRGNRGNRLRQS